MEEKKKYQRGSVKRGYKNMAYALPIEFIQRVNEMGKEHSVSNAAILMALLDSYGENAEAFEKGLSRVRDRIKREKEELLADNAAKRAIEKGELEEFRVWKAQRVRESDV